MKPDNDSNWEFSGILKQHPWHGVQIGANYPSQVTSYIEIVPTDSVKYEMDKFSGYLKIDRPQKYSNVCPTLYGFIPQTYCAELVADECMQKTGRQGVTGDGDALDICVLTEKQISHGDFLLQAIPIGGLRVIDGNEADDKIIAIMRHDSAFGEWKDITDCPKTMVERLKHYFLTYKDPPGKPEHRCELMGIYGAEEARALIRKSHQDYLNHYGNLAAMLEKAVAAVGAGQRLKVNP